MEPALKEHSIVLVSSIPYSFSPPQNSDIVVFKRGKKIFIKRIKKREDDKYFVEGDNKKDSLFVGWIERRDIMGKVVWILRST